MDLSIVNQNQEEKISSLELAELCGKQHKNVLADIKKMEPSYLKMFGDGLTFKLIYYTDKANRQKPCYSLTKSQSLALVSGYNVDIRLAVQKRWEELETQHQAQQNIYANKTVGEVALMHAQVLIENEKLSIENTEQKSQIQLFSATNKDKLFGEVAKIIEVAPNSLFRAMRYKGHLVRGNAPSQRMIKSGIMKYKKHNKATCVTPYFTEKGLKWILKYADNIKKAIEIMDKVQ